LKSGTIHAGTGEKNKKIALKPLFTVFLKKRYDIFTQYFTKLPLKFTVRWFETSFIVVFILSFLYENASIFLFFYGYGLRRY